MADHVNRYAAMGPRLTLNPGATAVRTEPLYMGSSLYQLSKRAPKFASKGCEAAAGAHQRPDKKTSCLFVCR